MDDESGEMKVKADTMRVAVHFFFLDQLADYPLIYIALRRYTRARDSLERITWIVRAIPNHHNFVAFPLYIRKACLKCFRTDMSIRARIGYRFDIVRLVFVLLIHI